MKVDANWKPHAHARLCHCSPSVTLHGSERWTCSGDSQTLLPTGIQRVTSGDMHPNSASYWIQWKTYPSSEKTRSFLSGFVWVSSNLVTERGGVHRYEIGHTKKNRMAPTWGVCEITWLMVTRCWRPVCVPWFWHLTTPILPWWPLPSASPSPGLRSPRHRGPQATPKAKVSAWGPSCKIGLFLFEKHKQGKQSHIT